MANAKELRIIYGHNDTNAALIQTAESNGSVTPGVTLMPMTYTSAAGGGACIIFTLEDGSFIVIDGGWNEEAAVLYDTLKALNEEVNGADAPIVISAWILTHAHVDHTGCIYRFSQNHGDEVAVNAILCNDVAEPQMSDSKVISYLNAENLKKVLQYFKTTTGEPTAVMKVHSGQKLTFGGAVLDVIFTHEDMVTQKVGNFNNLNTVIRLQLGGDTFFLTADATSSELKKMLNEITLEEFKADFCQVGHHGADSGYKGIYEAVEAKYYLWCNSEKHYIRDTEENKYDWDMYILENGKEIYLADTYCYTMELPYAEGSAIQWVPGSEKPSDK